MDILKPKNFSKYEILQHKGFEQVTLPNGDPAKIAYNKIYHNASDDLSIELLNIKKIENKIDKDKQLKKPPQGIHISQLKFHYRQAISLISPQIASGWNRWSENILELFIQGKTHKVLWGSGNCGKSAIMAILLYTKWRVNPAERMVVIASKVMTDATARVFGYIKEFHAKAPVDPVNKIIPSDNAREKGIFTTFLDKDTGKVLKNDRGCIITLPVKVNAKTAEMGSNLLGKHPNDKLILAFDEAQELPGTMINDKIFLNWYTNKNLDVYIWGNPSTIDYNALDSWDLLFKSGADKISLASLKNKEKNTHRTDAWQWHDTVVLRLTMLDSPKDDLEEQTYKIKQPDGSFKQRLHFLAGKENVENMARNTTPNSPAWYSQVLGFPFIDTQNTNNQGVISPFLAKECARYPLIWLDNKQEFYMGVDPAVTGTGDEASIVIAKYGKMEDDRMGIDLMNGEACHHVQRIEGTEFQDATLEHMFRLSIKYNIPLKNIAIETHGTGEAFKYALARHIEAGKWRNNYNNGQRAYIVSPNKPPSTLPLFKTLLHNYPAKDIVASASTELYMAICCLFLSRQIFNIPELILQQLYSRRLLASENAAAKLKIEEKAKLKARGIKSPNDADALANIIDLLRNRENFIYKMSEQAEYDYNRRTHRQKKLDQQTTAKALSTISRKLNLNTNLATNKPIIKHKTNSV